MMDFPDESPRTYQRGRMRFQFGSTCLRISALSSRLRNGNLGVTLAAAGQLIVIQIDAQARAIRNRARSR